LRVLLINPNTSAATTAQMVAIAQASAPAGVEVVGTTARCGPPMILKAEELSAAGPGVVEIGIAKAGEVAGIIISAFGDPGLAELRQLVDVPVVGIAEAAMLEASAGRRRFGVATVTPNLAGPIAARARDVGVADLYVGIRLTPQDPLTLVAELPLLVAALAEAVRQSIECDGAEAVAIGGGPLGQAAIALTPRFAAPIIAPIPAAIHRLMDALQPGFQR
jgi:Asp/Glu/hydantoin racemase